MNPSEKYESQLGWLFPIYGKIKNGNQTTNQLVLLKREIAPRILRCLVIPLLHRPRSPTSLAASLLGPRHLLSFMSNTHFCPLSSFTSTLPMPGISFRPRRLKTSQRKTEVMRGLNGGGSSKAIGDSSWLIFTKNISKNNILSHTEWKLVTGKHEWLCRVRLEPLDFITASQGAKIFRLIHEAERLVHRAGIPGIRRYKKIVVFPLSVCSPKKVSDPTKLTKCQLKNWPANVIPKGMEGLPTARP